MPTSSGRVPFAEIYEVAQNELIRAKSTDTAAENKFKGAVNEVYMEDLMLMFHEDYLRKEGTITTIADYSTGNAYTVSGTTLTGASTLWTSANSNNMLLKVTGYNEVYRVTYVSATSLTLDRSWAETAFSATNTAYRLVQDRYALASDFNHMCQDDIDYPEAAYYWRSGAKAFLKPKADAGEYDMNWSHTYGAPGEYAVKYVTGSPYIYLYPPDTDSRTIIYNYIPALVPMVEYTTGYISAITNGATGVTGAGSDWDGNVDTASYTYFFRVDADGVGSASQWYQVSSASADTTITLSSNYLGTSISSGASTDKYTISRISLWPAKFDHLIAYLAALRVDPDNTDAKKWSDFALGKTTGLKGRDGRAVLGQHGAFKRGRR